MTPKHRPDPVNQFNRLIEVRPIYEYRLGSRWNNVRVVNGHTVNLDGANCMCATFAMALDAGTGGRSTTSPNNIRNAQSDLSAGIGMDDGNRALVKLGFPAEMVTIPAGADWGDAMEFVRQGRFVIAGVIYSAVPWTYQEQKGGRFDHVLGMCDVRSDGSILRYDSLGKAPKRFPQQSVRLGAEAYGLLRRGSKSRLYIGYTDIMPAPPVATNVIFRYGGQPRLRGRYKARTVPLIPVRTQPRQDAAVFYRMKPGQTFKCSQTTTTGDSLHGSTVWHGTADGRCWVHSSLLWYAGASTGKETVR